MASGSYAQQPDSLIKKLDSLKQQRDTVGQVNIIAPEAYENTRLNLKSYFVLLASDVKQQVLVPFRASKKDWMKIGAYAVATGAVAFADKPLQEIALDLRGDTNNLYRDISRQITNFGGPYETYLLAGLGVYGLVFKKHKMFNTVLLATQSYLIGGAITSVIKTISGRQRPIYVDPVTKESRPIFHGPFYRFKNGPDGEYPPPSARVSFPSGHTTVVFSAATVFAMEYKDKPLIPILAYSAATLVGVSRITENKHWATDVLVGGLIGYLSGRNVVNNYHRLAKLQRLNNNKRSLTFNLQVVDGRPVPGVVYRF